MLFITTLCLLLELFVHPFVHMTIFPLNQRPEIQSRYFLRFLEDYGLLKKGIFMKTLLKVDRKRSKRLQNDNHVFSMHPQKSTYIATRSSVFFKRFIVDSLKRIKTVVWKRIDRRVFHDNENAYF